MSETKRNQFTEWMNEHLFAAGMVVMLLYILLRRTSYFIFRSLLPKNGITTVIHEITDVIWPFLMVALFGRLNVYRKGGFFRTLFLGISLILYGFVFGYLGNFISLSQVEGLEWQTPLMMIWGVITMLFVGFREESVYRGILVNVFADKYAKDRRGILLTAFGASLFFGLMHMQNVFIGQSFLESVLQTLNAFFLGSVFAAVYLRGGNLWAVMVIHGFIDLGLTAKNMLTKTFASDAAAYLASHTQTTVDAGEMIFRIILWAVYVLIALFLLRKSKCNEIIDRRRKEV